MLYNFYLTQFSISAIIKKKFGRRPYTLNDVMLGTDKLIWNCPRFQEGVGLRAEDVGLRAEDVGLRAEAKTFPLRSNKSPQLNWHTIYRDTIYQ